MGKKVEPGTPRIDPIPRSVEMNEKATPPETNLHGFMTAVPEGDYTNKMRSEVMEISTDLQSPRNLGMKTELSKRLVNLSARSKVWSRRHKSKVMDAFIKDVHIYLISLNRKGRVEQVELAKSINGAIAESNSGLGGLKKLVTGK